VLPEPEAPAVAAPGGRCGARNRQGQPCGNRPAKGKARCRFHGGASTGPITDAGRLRCAEANVIHGARAESDAYRAALARARPDLFDAPAAGALDLTPELRFARARLGVLAERADPTFAEAEARLLDAIRRTVEAQAALPSPDAQPQAGGLRLTLQVVRPDGAEWPRPKEPMDAPKPEGSAEGHDEGQSEPMGP